MVTKMANARIPEDLKTAGDAVLQREGITFTTVVNAFYEYLVREQSIPEGFLSETNTIRSCMDSRRQALRAFAGCAVQPDGAPRAISLEDIRAERLARQ